MSPEFKSVWIEGTCRGNKTTLHPGYTQGRLVWTVHATCPRDTSENKPIRKRNHDMSLRQDPPCEHFKKPIPATCPCVWKTHEILPRDMSLQHVPSCEPTLMPCALAAIRLCDTWLHKDTLYKKSLLFCSFWKWYSWEAYQLPLYSLAVYSLSCLQQANIVQTFQLNKASSITLCLGSAFDWRACRKSSLALSISPRRA